LFASEDSFVLDHQSDEDYHHRIVFRSNAGPGFDGWAGDASCVATTRDKMHFRELR
jgi:hypothetical protein